ncbi:hypothetical protein [Haloferax sp. Atlit-10N]|uniref:hypothetical protein n=2 Tax=unclassified Haloferax TaxID=2625095 RepID=UPI0011C3CBCE|nr:hypothetical protein [Haloferax sp. Atlit-10N]
MFEAIEETTRKGPSMMFSLGRVFAIHSIGLIVVMALMGVMLGGNIGLDATTIDQARVPADDFDIDIGEVERSDNPYIPNEFEQPYGDQSVEPPAQRSAIAEWYRSCIQKMIDTGLGTAIVVGNATARFAFSNKWVPAIVYDSVGASGLLGFVGYHFVRLNRSVMSHG